MAATVNIASTLKQTGWGDRRPEHMITSIILKNDVIKNWTIIEGVKKKAQIPTRDAKITWGNDFCNIKAGGDGTLDLGEKEVTNEPFTWFFSNCQTTLFDTYRSVMMRKGVNNEETLDTELKEWLFDFFAKKNAEKALLLAGEKIKAKIAADEQVIKVQHAEEPVLTQLKKMYEAMPKELLDMIMGEADQEYRPVIYMNSVTLRKYILEVAEANSKMSFAGYEQAQTPTYLGMKIELFSSLADGDIIITQPSNLLVITDDLGDIEAINAKYDELTSTDQFFGKFLLGFDYRNSKLIVSKIDGDDPSPMALSTRTRGSK